jgi:ABC-type transport system involved in multi-copper enzyme maturation permease subunit
MDRILRIELRKIIHNRVFWFTAVGYIITLLLILLGMRHQIIRLNEHLSEGNTGFIPLLPTEIYSFPHVWHNLTYIASYLMIFLSIVMVILVTNEFTYNTMRQNLINGLSRFQLVLSKFVDAVMLSIMATLFIFIFGLISGFLTSSNFEFGDVFSKISYLGAYFLMILGFLTFVMMLAFLIKKPALVLGTLLLYNFIVEPILSFWLDESIGYYLPLKSFGLLIEKPDIALFSFFGIKPMFNGISPLYVGISLFYLGAFLGISYLIIKRRDL